MRDSQDYNKELKPIKTLKQLVSSYYVALAITKIREEFVDKKSNVADFVPKIKTKDKNIIDYYHRYAKVVHYSPILVILCKIILEDIEKYDFSSDPSVNINKDGETAHLQKNQRIASNYTLLSNINLKDHTLRVFDIALTKAESKGRVLQIAVPALGALLHDFGKSSKIREELYGDGFNKNAVTHAIASEEYVKSVLYKNLFKETGETEEESSVIEMLAFLVRNHHNSNKEVLMDAGVNFIKSVDISARLIEIKELMQKNVKESIL